MTCEICSGTGWRPVDRDGARAVERCVCWQNARVAKLLANSGIEPRYARCTLDGFLVYPNEKLQNAVARAKKFVREFPAVDKGLIFIGPPGIGKTHLAVAILRQLIVERRIRGLFYDVPTLLKNIRSTYNPVVRTAEIDVIRPVMEAELLVLDDLGKEKPSEWVEETMNLIVGTRYNQKRTTIFTTNFEVLEDLTAVDSLPVKVGFRTWSRLHEMCDFVEYDGGDYRELPTNGGADDMVTLWKQHRGRTRLSTARLPGAARAQLAQNASARSADRELKWPGGKAGR